MAEGGEVGRGRSCLTGFTVTYIVAPGLTDSQWGPFVSGGHSLLGSLQLQRAPLFSFSPCTFSSHWPCWVPFTSRWLRWVGSKISPSQFPSWGPASNPWEVVTVDVPLALNIPSLFCQQAASASLCLWTSAGMSLTRPLSPTHSSRQGQVVLLKPISAGLKRKKPLLLDPM